MFFNHEHSYDSFHKSRKYVFRILLLYLVTTLILSHKNLFVTHSS